jgi:hypothetical protein
VENSKAPLNLLEFKAGMADKMAEKLALNMMNAVALAHMAGIDASQVGECGCFDCEWFREYERVVDEAGEPMSDEPHD